jgi:hypothetical protein
LEYRLQAVVSTNPFALVEVVVERFQLFDRP